MLRALETGSCDAAVGLCREKQYESLTRVAEKKHLETERICDLPLELTCRRTHPLIQSGAIDYHLLDQYPVFSSIPFSGSGLYTPAPLARLGETALKRIVMGPCASRYRLLLDSDGYLVSLPVPKEETKEYDLESLPIADSDLTVLLLYHRNPQKTELIREYIGNLRLCMEGSSQ